MYGEKLKKAEHQQIQILWLDSHSNLTVNNVFRLTAQAAVTMTFDLRLKG